MKKQNANVRLISIILSLIMAVSVISLIPGAKVNADPGPAGIIVTLTGDPNPILNSLKTDSDDVVAFRGTTVSFKLLMKGWEEYGGGTWEPRVENGVITEGILSDSDKVVVDNDKQTITIDADAPDNVRLIYAYRIYDTTKNAYSDKWEKWGEFGPGVTLKTFDKTTAYSSFFAENLKVYVDKGLVAGCSSNISTQWTGNPQFAKVEDIKLSATGSGAKLSGNKLKVPASVTKDTSVSVNVSAKLNGVNVSKSVSFEVFAKYALCVNSAVTIKLGKSTSIKPYFMERTASKNGAVTEKKSSLKSSDKVTYKTADKKTATVNKKGKITASFSSVGTTSVSVKVVRAKKAYTAKCDVYVEEGTIGTTVKSAVKKPSQKGKKIKILSWNDEFQNRVNLVLEKYPEYKKLVEFIIVPTSDNAYQEYLKKIENGKAPVPDIILSEPDYIDSVLNLDYVVPVSKIGYNEDWYAYSYPYAREIGKKDGKQYALTWQVCPSTFIYQKSVAKAVWGTDNPVEVQKKLKNWSAFEKSAAELKSKDYNIVPTVNDISRAYLVGSSRYLTNGKNIYLGSTVDKLLNLQKDLYTSYGAFNEDLWGDNWFNACGDGKTLGYIGPQWFYDFCLNEQQNLYDICEGPSDSYWGGSWVLATNAGRNNDLATFILYELTSDPDFMVEVNKKTNDIVNNTIANKRIISSKDTDEVKRRFIKEYDNVARNIPARNPEPYLSSVEGAINFVSISYVDGGIDSLSDAKKKIASRIKDIHPDLIVNVSGDGKEVKKTKAKDSAIVKIKAGDVVLTNDKNGIYVVNKVNKKGIVSVSYMQPAKKNLTKVSIPATVKLLTTGAKVKVTGISDKAFAGNKKIKSLVIGKNVQTIGASAFNGAKKLKTINIKSNNIKKVGKGAFVKINSKVKIKCAAKKAANYKKMFVKKGLSKSVKVGK